MSRLTADNVEQLRAASTAIPSGIAPAISSKIFQSQYSMSKRSSISLEHHFSIESRKFRGSVMKQEASKHCDRKLISLSVGRPNEDLYPWNSARFGLSPFATKVEKLHYSVERQSGYDIGTALNYGHPMGSPPLVRFLTEHVEIVHDPPYKDWNVCVTCGSTNSMQICLRIFCNHGDVVLSEEFTYPGFKEVATLVGVYVQGVSMDSSGIRSDVLERTLIDWDYSKGPKPRLLYTIPCGQNPTGCTQSLERKKALYKIAQQHDLIIIEDDPYYFLNLRSCSSVPKAIDCIETRTRDCYQDYLASLVPSFLSMDYDGRVVRLDSTSKILSPGIRVGWVTANVKIVEKFVAYNEIDAITASGPSQLMLFQLFENTWGHQGFMSWLRELSQIYCRRGEIVKNALKKFIPEEVCHWTLPHYGMFFWLHLNLNRHPTTSRISSRDTDSSALDVSDIETRIMANALEKGVKVAVGALFRTNKGSASEAYIRLTFAAANEVDLERATRVVANAIKKEFQL